MVNREDGNNEKRMMDNGSMDRIENTEMKHMQHPRSKLKLGKGSPHGERLTRYRTEIEGQSL